MKYLIILMSLVVVLFSALGLFFGTVWIDQNILGSTLPYKPCGQWMVPEGEVWVAIMVAAVGTPFWGWTRWLNNFEVNGE